MFTRLQTPEGMRDYLPQEVEQYLHIEQTLRKAFKLWGYEEVRSPVIEFVDALSIGVDPDFIDNMFKFQDRDGKILALRAEMTTPIARIVATKMSSKPKPLRLFYICNVFRYNRSYFEKLREFHQAGVELIGCNKPEADGEIISLLLFSTEKIGLDKVRIDLGHAGLLSEILNIMRLQESEKEFFQKILKSRNTAKIEKFTEDFNTPSELKDLLLRLLKCARLKDLQSISLDSGLVKVQKIFEELLEINDILFDYGVEKEVFFDFSLARGIGYYTGVVFEASVSNIGLPLGGGGRYDNLLEKLSGVKLPATGFAIEVEKCLWALDNRDLEISKRSEPKALVKSKSRSAGIKVSKFLRDAKIPCLLNFDETDVKDVIEYAKQAGISHVIFAGSSTEEPLEIHDVELGLVEKSKLQSFVKSVRNRYYE